MWVFVEKKNWRLFENAPAVIENKQTGCLHCRKHLPEDLGQ